MKSIQAALIIWFVFGNCIDAHQIHKRMVDDSNLSPQSETAFKNETSDVPQTEGSIKVTIVTENPTEVVVPIPDGAETNITHIQTESSLEIKEPISSTNEPVSIPPKSKTEPESVPAFISIDSDYNLNDENLTSETPEVLNPIEKLSSDHKPHLKSQIAKFANATTSVLSEVESEIGLLFEIAEGIEHKRDFPSKSNDSAEEIITVVIHPDKSDNSEDTKSKAQTDEAHFFEEFSPFFPIESFFTHLFRPEEAIIIETDTTIKRPNEHFANNSESTEKGHTSEGVLSKK